MHCARWWVTAATIWTWLHQEQSHGTTKTCLVGVCITQPRTWSILTWLSRSVSSRHGTGLAHQIPRRYWTQICRQQAVSRQSYTRATQVHKLIAYVAVGHAFESWFAQRLLSVADPGFTGAGHMLPCKMVMKTPARCQRRCSTPSHIFHLKPRDGWALDGWLTSVDSSAEQKPKVYNLQRNVGNKQGMYISCGRRLPVLTKTEHRWQSSPPSLHVLQENPKHFNEEVLHFLCSIGKNT